MPTPLEISTAYARLTLQSALLPVDGLLDGTGVTAGFLMSADYIGWEKLAAIFRNIDRHEEVSPAWAARLGGQFSASAHGSLGFAALSAPTLGAAVETLAEFYPARVAAIAIELERTDGRYVMHVQDVTGDTDFSRSLAEIVLKVIESLLSAILGHPVSDTVVVSLMRPVPAAAKELMAAYDAQVLFDAPSNAISIPASWWRLPSPLHDESMYRANMAKCRELVTSREQQGSVPVIVGAHLRNHFDRQISGESEPAPPPTQETIAAAMHLTTRTLIRRLKSEGTAYKVILEELRREYAQVLRGDARLAVADIATLLGYQEPANFSRAFRRWFGTSPAQWRRR